MVKPNRQLLKLLKGTHEMVTILQVQVQAQAPKKTVLVQVQARNRIPKNKGLVKVLTPNR